MRKERHLWMTALITISQMGAICWSSATFAENITQGNQSATNKPLIEEVQVTAARLKKEPVQNTPIAVSVMSPSQLSKINATDITQMSSLAPNLTINPIGTSPGVPAISLRGFITRTSDISSEPGIPVYIDGVYQTIITGGVADLYDVQRVEVLRGPQGTLLGKNAGAGAILITRTRPTGTYGGKVEAEYGTYNLRQVQALLNFPIVDGVLSGKLYANFHKRDGWVHDLSYSGKYLGAQQRWTVRGAILYTPVDQFELYLTADYSQDNSGQNGYRNVSTPTSLGCVYFNVCGPHIGMYGVTSATFIKKPDVNEKNVTANAKWTGDAVTLTSITGYRNYNNTNNQDLDSSPAPILQVFDSETKMDQYSEEIRLSSVQNGGLDMGGRLSWLVAGYYGYSDATMTQGLLAFANPSQQEEESIRHSKALFAHIDYDISQSTTFSLGGRHSWDETKHRFALPAAGIVVPTMNYSQSARFGNSSYEAGIKYQIDDTKMVYYRWAQGYRGGGFVGLPGTLAAARSFDPETSISNEIGLKTTWLNGDFLFNLTLFNVKYSNLQRDIVGAGPNNTFVQITANAAAATTRGVELESVARVSDRLTFNMNAGYLKAFYDRFTSLDPQTGSTLDLSKQPLTYAPKYTATVGMDYSSSLGDEGILGFDDVDFNINYDWRDSFEMSNTLNPVGHQGAYGLVNASVKISNTEGGYSITPYVSNLLNKRYITIGEDISNIVQFKTDGIGRTVGVRAELKF